MSVSVELRLRKLEEAEEARALERWVRLFAEAFGVEEGEARDTLERTVAAVERCAGIADVSCRVACIADELGLRVDPADLVVSLNQWSAARAAGLSDEALLRSWAAERRPRGETQRVDS